MIVTRTVTNDAGVDQPSTVVVTDVSAVPLRRPVLQLSPSRRSRRTVIAFTTIVTEVKTLPNPFSSVSFYATDDGWLLPPLNSG